MGNLDFEGLVNARDLGGIPIPGVGSIRPGVLYRSETPQLMTPDDVARAVGDFGIRRVVDLRGPRGRTSGPVGAGGRRVAVDFFASVGGIDTVDSSPEGFLTSLIDRGGTAVGAVLELLVEADGPTLVHCHTGKDRTGFVVAVILACIGVDDRHIILDYERSVPVFDQLMANLEVAGLAVPPDAPAYARHAPSPAGLATLLHRLRTRWPTPAHYLVEQGVEQSLLDRAHEVLRAGRG